MANSKKKKYKKKPQQAKKQQLNKTNTTKKPQKEGFFARRARLKKERERLEKMAAIEAERAAKRAKREEEKARREKLSKESRQPKSETEKAPKTDQLKVGEKAGQSNNIAVPEVIQTATREEDTPVVIKPSVSVESQVTEPVPEPVQELAAEPAADIVAEEKTFESESKGNEEVAKETAPFSGMSVKEEKTVKTTEKSSKPSAKKGKKLVLIIVFLVILAGVAVLILFGSKGKNYVPEEAILTYRGAKAHPSTVSDINIDAEEEARRIDLLEMKGDKTKFKFYCNLTDTMKIEEWYTPFYPCLANPKDNDCDFIITIFDQDGELIYRSLGLTPGKYIPKVKLFGNRDYGAYKCRLCVAAYDSKTYENIGVQYKDFTLLVGIEEENETEQVSTEKRTTLPATEQATTAGTTANQTETTAAITAAGTTAATTTTTATTAAETEATTVSAAS